ncbi:MAG: hypothetical protein RI565_00195 [Schleiferiaceae bacterium]|nr:hypothetical protein [Schleiferiaceae bacterium]
MEKTKQATYLGHTPLRQADHPVKGYYENRAGEKFYCIEGFAQMPPFLMSLVSSSDQWLFIASNGALTAGRKSPDTALFPYYTVDKIFHAADITGSKTLLRVYRAGTWQLWEPFSAAGPSVYRVKTRLCKNQTGNVLRFEAHNEDLELSFVYQWRFSPEHGFLRDASLHNTGAQNQSVEVLDGLQNLLPWGIDRHLQNNLSTLADAYKKAELSPAGMGIFSLSSMVVDRAEPSEALRATTVWQSGLPAQKHLLSSRQLDRFRHGAPLENETLVRAQRGAFFVQAALELAPEATQEWLMVAEVAQSTASTLRLENRLARKKELYQEVQASQQLDTESLHQKIAAADGLQHTADELAAGRHYGNVLFNIMRGGVFEDGYLLPKKAFQAHIHHFNKPLYQDQEAFLASLPSPLPLARLSQQVRDKGDLDLIRLTAEFLPLSFSRRHGDPSRPWNHFTIHGLDANGHTQMHYEGNWRDIFQNWEALAYAFPAFAEGMIFKFLNASTIDGYNPYRITQDGIDWEVIDPQDPWSYIGYWGDHQIIYLLKLLEHQENHYPGRLASYLDQDWFVYAQVPYRQKTYEQLLEDPHNTILYEEELAKEIAEREKHLGADGRLVHDAKEQRVRANLTEKLLLPALTKLSHFVPEAGIWLNTQRPEWNDANNALVGNGASMVTLYYLRRFLRFLPQLLDGRQKPLTVNAPLAHLLQALHSAFADYAPVARQKGGFSDPERKAMLDRLGQAGERYRETVYQAPHQERVALKPDSIRDFCEAVMPVIDASIERNEGADGLYEAYNILHLQPEAIGVKRLYPMLEGQVAVLSAGYLNPEQALALLDKLKESPLFRPDQYSYLLYPDKALPSFLAKNTLDRKEVAHSALLQELELRGDHRLVEQDQAGDYHFGGDLHNARDLRSLLAELRQEETLQPLVDAERERWEAAFEATFDHQSFTGRSGTFFAFEGLGSIYWHMVSKLLLAVQEQLYAAQGARKELRGRLINHYYEIRAGIGIDKGPELYGAFPTDAYSHTPAHAGAQQPGMTGQVKEDILNRWAELGVQVKGGQVYFAPHFLRREEFWEEAGTFSFYAGKEKETLALPPNSLAFTYAGLPVIYRKASNPLLRLHYRNGTVQERERLHLSPEESQGLLARDEAFHHLEVHLPGSHLL